MGKAKEVPRVQERDWVQELEDAQRVDSLPLQHYVNKLGSQQEFNAAEHAGIMGWITTDPVYALVDEGKIEYLDRGHGNKRYCIFPRACVINYLKSRCNHI